MHGHLIDQFVLTATSLRHSQVVGSNLCLPLKEPERLTTEQKEQVLQERSKLAVSSPAQAVQDQRLQPVAL